MEYVLDYCIASVFYLGATMFFYFRQHNVPSVRNRLYGLLLILGFVSVVFDFLAAWEDPFARRLPLWLPVLVNLIFLFSMQANGPAFLFYTLVLTGKYPRLTKRARILLLLPFLAVCALLLLSPFSRAGIFYMDADHVYHHGAAHWTLYVVMALYLVGSATLVYRCRRTIRLRKKLAIYGFLLIVFIAMLIQSFHPEMLVNTMACAFALTMMFYTLQASSDHVDSLTRVFNATALEEMLQDLYEQRQPFSVLLFTIRSFRTINQTLGVKAGDAVLVTFAGKLKKAFPNSSVFRITGNAFCVLDGSGKAPDRKRLGEMLALLPETLNVEENEAALTLKTGCIHSACASGRSGMQELIQKTLYELKRLNSKQPIFLVDEGVLSEWARQSVVEKTLQHALETGEIQVFYQPLHDGSGRLTALEALCRIPSPEGGYLDTETFIRIAEQNGSIHKLGETVLRKTCAFVRDHGLSEWGLEHIGVNLSVAQCLQKSLAPTLTGIVSEYGIRPGLIRFELTETEAASSMPAVKENMEKLAEQGFTFLLDDFGSGYANFNYIARLPFYCVKLDKTLLWNAVKDPAWMAMLEGLSDALKRLHLESVCEGVETKEQAELVTKLGITMQQGYYYAKPLPEEALLRYGKACAADACGEKGASE